MLAVPGRPQIKRQTRRMSHTTRMIITMVPTIPYPNIQIGSFARRFESLARVRVCAQHASGHVELSPFEAIERFIERSLHPNDIVNRTVGQ